MRKKIILAIIIVSFPFMITKTQDELQEKEKAIIPGFNYIGEFANNINGGIETGSAYLGLIDLCVDIDFENAGLWNGGELYIQIENTHGATPSANLVGDFQVFSNIDNGNFTYLYEIWYKHCVGKFSFQTGIIDLNADFLSSDNGSLYANSSFGIMPAVSMNMPVPIFPKNALGVVLEYDINELFRIQTSIFDGDPSSLDAQENGLDVGWSSDEGVLSVSEINLNRENKSGVYKLGLVYHSSDFIHLIDSVVKKGNLALYTIIDQEIFNDFSGFFKIGWSLPDYSYNELFIGGGINISSPFASRKDDVAGIAVGYARVSKTVNKIINIPAETAIEATYLLRITDYLGIQPYIQYIINPGTGNALDDAFIGALRLNVEL